MSRYLEYLLGRPVSFEVAARASPQQISERLKAEVGSRFWPFHFEKVVGRVGPAGLSIEWRGSAFSSNMAPRLRGKLVPAGVGTRFEGRFGAPLFVRFLLVLWTCFDLIFALLMLSGSSTVEGMPWFAFLFLLVHLLFPFAISAMGMIGADRVQQRLTDFVIETGSGRR